MQESEDSKFVLLSCILLCIHRALSGNYWVTVGVTIEFYSLGFMPQYQIQLRGGYWQVQLDSYFTQVLETGCERQILCLDE